MFKKIQKWRDDEKLKNLLPTLESRGFRSGRLNIKKLKYNCDIIIEIIYNYDDFH